MVNQAHTQNDTRVNASHMNRMIPYLVFMARDKPIRLDRSKHFLNNFLILDLRENIYFKLNVININISEK
jgi:hypothetical protein